MKIHRANFASSKQNETGSAVLIFTILAAIMLILVAVNSKTLFVLHRDIQLLNQKQIQRLAAPTNSIAATDLNSK